MENTNAPAPLSEAKDQKAAKRIFKKVESMKAALSELSALDSTYKQNPEQYIQALDKAERACYGFASACKRLDPENN